MWSFRGPIASAGFRAHSPVHIFSAETIQISRLSHNERSVNKKTTANQDGDPVSLCSSRASELHPSAFPLRPNWEPALPRPSGTSLPLSPRNQGIKDFPSEGPAERSLLYPAARRSPGVATPELLKQSHPTAESKGSLKSGVFRVQCEPGHGGKGWARNPRPADGLALRAAQGSQEGPGDGDGRCCSRPCRHCGCFRS